jgi:hypothetical protein
MVTTRLARGPAPGRWSIDPAGTPFVAAAGVLIVAGGLVAAVNSAAPFAHGSWLAAYLVLVGGVSQVLLGVGGVALRATSGAGRLELALWNAGTLVVAFGVLVDASAIVALGSAALLIALARFGAATARGAPLRWRLAYQALIVALASSVLVGCALAIAA